VGFRILRKGLLGSIRAKEGGFTMTFTVECYSKETGWLPYAKASTMEEARMKAANAFIKTRHIEIRIKGAE
jgi:hypothetical protein